ncbi:unnamed protein product [Protopolystoma xenopodis]|uniref:Golgi phosphoprotein 3 n=1 Tax=Protopolystoma xenopodis TaxID=117903 RepID=A0A448X653_9PLAT|nr:unnamed protein product [Protopolystoma xenopodis]
MFQDDDGIVISRRNVHSYESENSATIKRSDLGDATDENDSKETRLTLMEEILLLGLKDREGYTSFWNDSICCGLRAAFLIELALRDRIGLEPAGMRMKALLSRKIIVKKDVPTGDVLLDEALKNIKSNYPENAKTWIEYLSGETWNPFKLSLQIRNVRERLAKSLAEKGVCTTEKQNFVLFDLTTHPLVDSQVKQRVIRRVQEAMLSRWTNDPQKIEKRLLSLVILSHHSDVLENAFSTLSDADYSISMKRIKTLLDMDYYTEAAKDGSCETMWAVFAAFTS